MARPQSRSYGQFNFLVDLGDGITRGPQAGFQELTGIGLETAAAKDRDSNHKENSVVKITGVNKSTDVTMKRGLISVPNLQQWLDQIRDGDQKAMRTITIQVQNDDHTAIVKTVRLVRARIVKHAGGPFNAKGTDVALEELVLAYERLEID